MEEPARILMSAKTILGYVMEDSVLIYVGLILAIVLEGFCLEKMELLV